MWPPVTRHGAKTRSEGARVLRGPPPTPCAGHAWVTSLHAEAGTESTLGHARTGGSDL